MNQDNTQSSLQNPLPQRILPVPFDQLKQAVMRHVNRNLRSESEGEGSRSMSLLEDFLFNLESLIFLDGEHRADLLMSHLLQWSSPGFTRRFFQTRRSLSEDQYKKDVQYVTNHLEEILKISHYTKLPPTIVEKSIKDMSYEKIFVRLQHVEFLNFYVRGSYLAVQNETLTRSMAKRIKAKDKWVRTFIAPESVEVFEELVVISSDIQQEKKEDTPTKINHDYARQPLDKEKMDRELHPYIREEGSKTLRPVAKRRRAIQRLVKEKMRKLQDKTLDEFIEEQSGKDHPKRCLHLLVYHHIPETDLELLLPNAEVSLGVKEYIQLCFTGSATLPALGKVFLGKSLRKLMMVFNPLVFGLYRVFYKMNIVRMEQRFFHARYMLKRLLARDAKAVSHLVDDYENVFKREAFLIYALLASLDRTHGLTQEELNRQAQDFARQHFHIEFDPDFSYALKILLRWGIIQSHSTNQRTYFTAPRLDALVKATSLTRQNVEEKITMQ